MGFGAFAAAAAPAVLGGIAGLAGGAAQNAANRKEAERNRKFQERMRNTQWQAAVADLQAAGLNPALAYSQGGNASPGGSMGSMEDAVSKGASSAMQAMQMRKSFQLMDAQISKTKWEADQARTKANLDQATAALLGMEEGDGSLRLDLRNQNALLARGLRAELGLKETNLEMAEFQKGLAGLDYEFFSNPMNLWLARVGLASSGIGAAGTGLIGAVNSMFKRGRPQPKRRR